jgi:hypothetical protein
MTNSSSLKPLFQFISDFSKAMIKDDQTDLAFPNRYHKGRIHHFHYGIVFGIFADLATELLGVYEVIKEEQFRVDDTIGTFVNRCISIHKNTYKEEVNNNAPDRVAMLNDYFKQLRGINNKSDLENKIENAIYMGRIKTVGQQRDEIVRVRKVKVKPRFPKPLPPPASSTKMRLYKQ